MKFTPLIAFFSCTAMADIAGWQEIQGITEQQAFKMAQQAIHQEIGVDDDGQVCGVDELWGWEREKDLVPDFPQERGEIFAIMGYAKGPHSKMLCSGTETYDCRVVFNKPKKHSIWKVEYTECEPSRRGPQRE